MLYLYWRYANQPKVLVSGYFMAEPVYVGASPFQINVNCPDLYSVDRSSGYPQ